MTTEKLLMTWACDYITVIQYRCVWPRTWSNECVYLLVFVADIIIIFIIIDYWLKFNTGSPYEYFPYFLRSITTQAHQLGHYCFEVNSMRNIIECYISDFHLCCFVRQAMRDCNVLAGIFVHSHISLFFRPSLRATYHYCAEQCHVIGTSYLSAFLWLLSGFSVMWSWKLELIYYDRFPHRMFVDYRK